jgi:hypothetical protein
MFKKNIRPDDSRIIGKGDLHRATRLEGKVKNRGIRNIKKKGRASK